MDRNSPNVKPAVKSSGKSGTKPAVKSVRRVTPDYLRNAGLFYLQRFPSSRARFETVLRRKIARAGQVHGAPTVDEAEAWLAAVCAEFERLGLLDDALYARALTRSLLARGVSLPLARQKLMSKGLAPDRIDAVLTEFYRSSNDSDGDAAMRLLLVWARRKRLPPFFPTRLEPHKLMGRFARAGFDFETIRQALSLSADEAAACIEDH